MKRVGYVVALAAVGAGLVWFSRSAAPPSPPAVTPRNVATETPMATPKPEAGEQSLGMHGTPATTTDALPENPPQPLSATDAPPPSDQAARDATAEIEVDRSGVPLVGHPERVRRLLKWAATDPAAATLWADRLTNPAKRQEALQAICFKIAERDPAAAIDMVEIYGLGNEPGVVENLIAQWSARDADGALAWIGHQPPGDERDALTKRVAFALSSSQPVEAARLIEESMGTGPLQTEAVASLVHQWSQRDPAAAREWVERLPPGPLRDRANQELATLRRATR